MDKAPDAYRTISEVAEDLDLPQHVLRFWETRFGQIRPLKRGGGRRYYRPEDIDLLKGIRHLLYGEGYTIRGVQRIIKENGVKAIQALGRGEGAAALQKPKGPDIIGAAQRDEDDDIDSAGAVGGTYVSPPFADDDGSSGDEAEDGEDDGREPVPASRPQAAVASAAEPSGPVAPRPVATDMPSARPSGNAQPAQAAAARLAADDVRRLQAALYELLECRKKLDEAI